MSAPVADSPSAVPIVECTHAMIAPGRREIARAMRATEANRWWYALRRPSQQMTYRVATAAVESQRPTLERRVAAATEGGPSSLALDPALLVPNYLTKLDIHHLEGGYHGERRPGDFAAGAIYDRQMTINRMGTQGRLNDDPGNTLAHWVAETYPGLAPRRILELGCTVSHTLLPFKEVFPDAEAIGVDVAAPLLRYGHARAARSARMSTSSSGTPGQRASRMRASTSSSRASCCTRPRARRCRASSPSAAACCVPAG